MADNTHENGKISIQHVRKDFRMGREVLHVLKDVNLDIEPGDIVSIIGGSGCGKSTLLRMVAGLDTPTSGNIEVNGKVIRHPSLDVGVLFQESRLLPWENTEKNIAFGLPEKMSKVPKKQLVRDAIKLVGLEGFEKALPGQLSGGMQKRVAIARTLINRPHVLLLDEPFGALDAFTRMNLQDEVLRIWEQEHMTTILVTHDIDEAIYMGNKVVIMSPKPGVVRKVIQVDLPKPKDRTGYDFEILRNRVYKEFFGSKEPVEDYVI